MWEFPLAAPLAALALLIGLAAPGVAAFVGALAWRVWGGVAGLVFGYVTPWLVLFWVIGVSSPCHPCKPFYLAQLPGYLVESMTWLPGAYAVSWPWHLAWLTYGGLGLWAGLRVRARRIAGKSKISKTVG